MTAALTRGAPHCTGMVSVQAGPVNFCKTHLSGSSCSHIRTYPVCMHAGPPADSNTPIIVALGKFDAMHIGHRSLAVTVRIQQASPLSASDFVCMHP